MYSIQGKMFCFFLNLDGESLWVKLLWASDWCEYIFTIFANISIPIEKGVTLHMNKLESSLTNLKFASGLVSVSGGGDENMKSLHTEWITRG